MIIDRFNRVHDYLRVAITDSCNFRCSYCMPSEDVQFLPTDKLMSVEEIEQLCSYFVELGVKKIRLTGGEPLVRKDVGSILERLSNLPVELTLTTNGVLVDRYIDTIISSGIKSINVSLDSLNFNKFLTITKRNEAKRVLDNISLLMNRGVYVKVNMVVMKGFNEMEIIDFVAMTQKKPLHVRFIEFMPFDGNSWSKKLVFTESEILNLIESKFDFFKIKDGKNDTARKFKPIGHEGTFAIISSMSHPFCDGCNRIRLTADGKLKNCLFSCEEVDLIEELRNCKSKILIKEKIISCFLKKEKERGGQFNNSFVNTNEKMLQNRSMIKIGG